MRICVEDSPSCTGILPCHGCGMRVRVEIMARAMHAAGLDRLRAQAFLEEWSRAWIAVVESETTRHAEMTLNGADAPVPDLPLCPSRFTGSEGEIYTCDLYSEHLGKHKQIARGVEPGGGDLVIAEWPEGQVSVREEPVSRTPTEEEKVLPAKEDDDVEPEGQVSARELEGGEEPDNEKAEPEQVPAQVADAEATEATSPNNGA